MNQPTADLPGQELATFSQPFDWHKIDQAMGNGGGVIVQGLLSPSDLQALNRQIDDYLAAHIDPGAADSGSAQYDKFLGANTIRLHGLIHKFPLCSPVIGHPEIVAWAERTLGNKASSVLLNAGELIQINPGEPAQYLHRDTDSWPIPLDVDPFIVNAIVALDNFSAENGATTLAPGSWQLPAGQRPGQDTLCQAVMSAGDALLFRGDLIHGGGANNSPRPRRALSISYCAGWLRPVENSYLNIPLATVLEQPNHIRALLGYAAHDGTNRNAGLVGLYENGGPEKYLEEASYAQGH